MSDIVNRLRFDFRDRDADEVEEMQQEITRLRADLAQRTAEVAKAEAERDEARREACALRVLCTTTSKNCEQIAAERGWDCFDAKEGKHG
jgi:chromosome segregation ATPase